MIRLVNDRIKNIVGKGENAGYQHFLLFQQCFPRPFSSGSFIVVIMQQRLKMSPELETYLSKSKSRQIYGQTEDIVCEDIQLLPNDIQILFSNV